jgi:hypothetical protein
MSAVPTWATCAVHPSFQALGPCPRCGTFACPQCMVLLANGDSLCRACESKGVLMLPWDDREQLGTMRAFFKTCVAMILRPGLTAATAGREGSLAASLLFALLAYGFASLSTGVIYGVVIGGVIGGERLDGSATPLWQIPAFAVGGALATVLSFVGLQLGGLVVLSGLEHLALRLVGARPHSFRVTVRAYALSLGPSLVGVVPYCSLYVLPVWSLALRVFTYRAMHQTTTGKAVAAALAPTLLLLLGLFTLLALSVMMTNGSFQ